MVRCDMEGSSGIVSYAQVDPADREYADGRALFMADLVALLRGLGEGGAEEVTVYDEHKQGRNVDLAQVPDYVTVLAGKPPYRPDWPGGLDQSYTGLVMLGLHAMKGVEGALLPHTYEGGVRAMRLNGQLVGEIGMEAAIAGEFGVPLVLVTGDSAAVQEALELCPDTIGVVVKDSVDSAGALCYPVTVTTTLIRQAARQVVATPPAVEPVRFEAPVRLEVVFEDGSFLEAMRGAYGPDFSDERTLGLEGGGPTEVYAEYWRRKLEARGEKR
jgi:D-amino peptidase